MLQYIGDETRDKKEQTGNTNGENGIQQRALGAVVDEGMQSRHRYRRSARFTRE